MPEGALSVTAFDRDETTYHELNYSKNKEAYLNVNKEANITKMKAKISNQGSSYILINYLDESGLKLGEESTSTGENDLDIPEGTAKIEFIYRTSNGSCKDYIYEISII